MAEGFRKLSIGLLTCTVSFVACGGPTVRESDDDPTYEDVLFEQLAGAPNRYHGNRVRVAGLCEIYFESTVLLLSENAGTIIVATQRCGRKLAGQSTRKSQRKLAST